MTTNKTNCAASVLSSCVTKIDKYGTVATGSTPLDIFRLLSEQYFNHVDIIQDITFYSKLTARLSPEQRCTQSGRFLRSSSKSTNTNLAIYPRYSGQLRNYQMRKFSTLMLARRVHMAKYRANLAHRHMAFPENG